jgi:hemoglobin
MTSHTTRPLTAIRYGADSTSPAWSGSMTFGCNATGDTTSRVAQDCIAADMRVSRMEHRESAEERRMSIEPNLLPTLLEWAGGETAIERLIDGFYDWVDSNELRSPMFPGGVSQEHCQQVTLWWVELFDAQLPADPDYRAAFLGYVEWGTRLALHDSNDGAEVVEQPPVPRWGRGPAARYQPPSHDPSHKA